MSNTFKDLGIEQVSVLMKFIFLWRRQISKANKYINRKVKSLPFHAAVLWRESVINSQLIHNS